MQQKPVTEKVQENVQNVVEDAKQELAAARRPWYRAIRWGFILLGVYAIQLTLFALSYRSMSPLPGNFRRTNPPGCVSP